MYQMDLHVCLQDRHGLSRTDDPAPAETARALQTMSSNLKKRTASIPLDPTRSPKKKKLAGDDAARDENRNACLQENSQDGCEERAFQKTTKIVESDDELAFKTRVERPKKVVALDQNDEGRKRDCSSDSDETEEEEEEEELVSLCV